MLHIPLIVFLFLMIQRSNLAGDTTLTCMRMTPKKAAGAREHDRGQRCSLNLFLVACLYSPGGMKRQSSSLLSLLCCIEYVLFFQALVVSTSIHLYAIAVA